MEDLDLERIEPALLYANELSNQIANQVLC
jgi:hypothetical protein